MIIGDKQHLELLREENNEEQDDFDLGCEKARRTDKANLEKQ